MNNCDERNEPNGAADLSQGSIDNPTNMDVPDSELVTEPADEGPADEGPADEEPADEEPADEEDNGDMSKIMKRLLEMEDRFKELKVGESSASDSSRTPEGSLYSS